MNEQQGNDRPSVEGVNLEALSKKRSLAERAGKGREFLSANNLDINKIAKDLSVPLTDNPADDGKFVTLVIKIQSKLGFKPRDSGSGQDGIFGRKTFEAYKEAVNRSNKEQTKLIATGKKLSGPSPAEIEAINQDQLELARLEKELGNPEPQAPVSAPPERLPPAAVASRPTTPSITVEPVKNPEIASSGIDLQAPSEICIIGDSNAMRLARRIPAAKTIGAEGLTSKQVLKMFSDQSNLAKLTGVKLVLLRVGGNDGEDISAEETLANIDKIVGICKSHGIPDIRILTRPPHVAASRGGRRSRAFAQRELTLAKYGEGKAKDDSGTKIAVVDLYKELAGDQKLDKNVKLSESIAADKGHLHMNGKGYLKALEIIARVTGTPKIAEWAAKKA